MFDHFVNNKLSKVNYPLPESLPDMVISEKLSGFVKRGKYQSSLCSFYRGKLPERLKYALKLVLFHCEILDIFRLLFS